MSKFVLSWPTEKEMQEIPTQELTHRNEKVFFAFRTMEENHERTGGKPDIPHRHDFYTIILVKKASGKHFVDYVEYPIKPGMLFFVSPEQVHQVVVEGDVPSGDIIMFNADFLMRYSISEDFILNLGLFSCCISTPPLLISENGINKLVALSSEIKEAFDNDSVYKFDTISAFLKLFLIECNRYAVPSKDTNPQNLQSGRPLIKNFRELLDKYYSDWHKVSDYANALNITSDYLNNVLKSNLGKTAKEMIFQRIILEAKRLGLHTELTSKEIAYRLGFDDPSHFSKFFKNETGESFSEFKVQLEKKLNP
jgi:AraC family transcriptional regulator, transcriptional activator of pobA